MLTIHAENAFHPCPSPIPRRVNKRKLVKTHIAQATELFKAHFRLAQIRRCYRECRPNRRRTSLLGNWLKLVISLLGGI